MAASFSDLTPGLYQVATPDEVEVRTTEIVLIEDQHFWKDSKTQKLQVNTVGLRLQAEYAGCHVRSGITTISQNYCLAEAVGYRLRADGMLEVYGRKKEYDMSRELMLAALKKVPRPNQDDQSKRPTEEQSKALAVRTTEETALALVSTLPAWAKIDVMQARLEVQGHRLALCETKAENQVLRYFIAKAGGVLSLPKAGFGKVTVRLVRVSLKVRIEPGDARQLAEQLFGPPRATVEPATAEPGQESPLAEDSPLPEDLSGDPDLTDLPGEERADENGGDRDDEPARDTAGLDEPDESAEAPAAPTAPAAPNGTGSQPGLPLNGTSGKPQADAGKCDLCGAPCNTAIVNYCKSEAGTARFGGAVVCWKCQKGAGNGA
jgi:hypothetical protein